jgi:hypothetical protein
LTEGAEVDVGVAVDAMAGVIPAVSTTPAARRALLKGSRRPSNSAQTLARFTFFAIKPVSVSLLVVGALQIGCAHPIARVALQARKDQLV